MSVKYSETRLSQQEFNDLLEYSTSLPTGTIVGKRWKRKRSGKWLIGEYIDHPDPDTIGIRWTRPKILNDDELVIRNRLYNN